MNSRIQSLLFYVLSLIIYIVILFYLNKYEREKAPVGRIKAIIEQIELGYRKRKMHSGLGEECTDDAVSNLHICLHIITGCGNVDHKPIATQLSTYIKNEIVSMDKNDLNSHGDISNITDLFNICVKLIDKEQIEKEVSNGKPNICTRIYSKNKSNEFFDNSYYIYMMESTEIPQSQKSDISFIVSSTNILEIHLGKGTDQLDNLHTNSFLKDAWYIVRRTFFAKPKNRQLEYTPELDLNFYIASSLYCEKNYKIKKYNFDMNGKRIKERTDVEVKEGEEGEGEIETAEQKELKSKRKYDDRFLNKSRIPVSIATWDFYTEFYYPYIRKFVEQLLNIYKINVYPQNLVNINLIKISEKAEKYIVMDKLKALQLDENARVIILDKVTKFTDEFDQVTIGNVLNKPTYKTPQNINLISIFPNEESVYFYNDVNESIETTVSFIEWGIININNYLTKIPKSEKKKSPLVNISSEAAVMSGLFISHLRGFLGLCSSFNDFPYHTLHSDSYKVSYEGAESKNVEMSVIYSIQSGESSLSYIYHIPMSSGITDYELLTIIREAYSYRIRETISNINKFLAISNMSMYVRIPKYTRKVIDTILNNIECSLSYMEGKECQHTDVNTMVHEQFKEVLLKKGINSKAVYFKIALVLSQTAYQDSLEILGDDQLSIYDILSKDFLLATILPLFFPFAVPVVVSLFKELPKNWSSRKKVKVE